MATRSWNTGSAGSWFTVANWTTTPPDPNNFPQPGDTVFINTGTPTIVAGNGIVDQEQVTLGAGSSASPAVLLLQGATLGSGMVIASGPGSAFGALQASGESVFAGTLVADAPGGLFTLDILNPGTAQTLSVTGVIDISAGDTVAVRSGLGGEVISTGTINVDGGTFLVTPGATFINSGSVVLSNSGVLDIEAATTASGSGTILGGGTIAIASSSTAVINTPFPYAQTVSFLDGTGTLALGDASTFVGNIINFQSGDAIDLIGQSNNWVSFVNGKLSLGAAGSDGKTATIRLGAPAGTVLGAQSDGHGGTLIEITTGQTWTSSTGGDWYDAGNWSGSVPGIGGVATLSSGSATITAADVAQHGALNDLQVLIGGIGTGTAAPTLQMTDETVGAGTSVSLIGGSQSDTEAQLILLGTSTLDGAITARGLHGLLTIDIGNDGTAGTLTVSQGEIGSSSGVIDSSSEAAVVLAGTGAVVNDGLIQVGGGFTINSGVTLSGFGMVQIVAAGTAVIDGAVAVGQAIQFNEPGEKLVIGSAASFQGTIENIVANDTIDLSGVVGDTLRYDANSNVLSVLQGSTVAAQLTLSGSYDGARFVLSSDGEGGTDIAYSQPTDEVETVVSLPVPAIGAPGSVLTLEQLLTSAFGKVPDNFIANGVTLSYGNAEDLAQNNSSYWDPSNPSVTTWRVNQIDTGGGPTVVSGSDLDKVTLQLGNNISPQAFVEVPVAFDHGTAVAYVKYQIATIDSSVAPGGYTTIAPTATDIVNAASLFASTFTDVPNNNDCPNISADVGASVGAVHPAQDASTNPDQNLPGGFWQIIYQGTTANPTQDWYSLLQSGDFVRMGWNNGGQHTTTVVDATVQPNGSIYVYDNDLPLAPGISGIGLHYDEYWPQTDPSTITIYRLNTTGQYLILGTSDRGEIIQGSVYNDLIEPLAGADTITGGPGNDEVRGTGADLAGDTITDWHSGDTLDFTTFDPNQVGTPDYDPSNGVLTVHAGTLTASVTLTANQTGPFVASADGSGGTLISEAPCYAAGTCIRTPGGNVPIEKLAVGDLVLTVGGEALPIMWLGYRHVDCMRHPKPATVWPVRIRAHAFGPALPARDLWLSPDHAVFVDDVLVPVKYLINGRSIAQVRRRQMRYFHLELPRHEVVLAEGLPAESYLDSGDRGKFANGGRVVTLFPDFSSRVWEAAGYAPLVVAGPQLVAIRRRLNDTKRRPSASVVAYPRTVGRQRRAR